MSAGIGRALVLASVFVCAACGLVYELELVALASYVGGDSVTQASVVLSVMVFAMGVGSLLAKRLRCRAATGFAAVEALLALVGGGSAMALYASFAWLGGASAAVVVFSFAIGVLIGAEMPLLMSLIQRIRQQDAGGAVADLFAADYVGALIGGLAFPFLLLPFFGQLTGALLTGVVNALAGGAVVLWLFRHDMSRHVRWGLLAANGGVVLLLAAGGVFVAPFERAAREAVYGPDVRVAVGEGEEAAVLTGPAGGRARGGSGSGAGSPTGSPAGGDSRAGAGGASGAGGDGAPGRAGGGVLRFYVGGALRVSSDEGNVLPAALVRPAMESGPHARVLVLGGEDGLALREVLRHAGVRHVTVLEQRARAAELARTDPGLRRLNGGAYDDPRVRLVRGRDAFAELRARARRPEPYDVVVSDLPDPSAHDVAKLYSQEFYGLVARSLTPGGRLAVRAAPAAAAPRTYWTVEATLRAAGLRTEPYVVREPRDTGFVLASRGGAARGVVLGEGNGGGDGDADGDVVTGGDGGVVTGVTGGGGRAGAGARGVPGPDAPAGAVVGQRRLLVGAERLGPGRVAPVPRTPTTRQLHAAGERAERSRIRGLPPSTLMRPRY